MHASLRGTTPGRACCVVVRGICVVHGCRGRGAVGTPGVHSAAADLRWAPHTWTPHWRKRALGDGTKVA
ncbi:hypothetical protein CBM2615_B170187 [Cupriavidus taiwanensis]|nr:hypothetical protein CBM2615_B170187 [Cupriavidus taiwanensis]